MPLKLNWNRIVENCLIVFFVIIPAYLGIIVIDFCWVGDRVVKTEMFDDKIKQLEYRDEEFLEVFKLMNDFRKQQIEDNDILRTQVNQLKEENPLCKKK